MLVDIFDYHLPPELVAQNPRPRRDDSRLLVLDRASGEISHARFRELDRWLDPGDLVVVNDTRVFPARLHGGAEVEGPEVGRRGVDDVVDVLEIDQPPVGVEAGEAVEKSMSAETTFGTDCADGAIQRQTLLELAEQVGRRLRADETPAPTKTNNATRAARNPDGGRMAQINSEPRG